MRGFSIVDPGGNWLRIYQLNDTEEGKSAENAGGLTQIIYVAARLGDAHGDEKAALKTLENGLARYASASALERAKAYLYRAELAVWTNNLELARASLELAKALDLTEDERATVAEELAQVTELVKQAEATSQNRGAKIGQDISL